MQYALVNVILRFPKCFFFFKTMNITLKLTYLIITSSSFAFFLEIETIKDHVKYQLKNAIKGRLHLECVLCICRVAMMH